MRAIFNTPPICRLFVIFYYFVFLLYNSQIQKSPILQMKKTYKWHNQKFLNKAQTECQKIRSDNFTDIL